jgi:uncharacterized protein DUF2877
VHVARVTEIGWKARAALDAGGVARVLAPLSASIYMTVDADIVWLGPAGATPHPRAILCADPLERPGIEPGDLVRVDATGVAPWRPAEMPATCDAAAAFARGAARLGAAARALGAPDGFGALLVGARPGFPLDAAEGRARALASACAADRPEEAAKAAWALLGLGPGLTPSGDDYVGGAFFARALLARAGAGTAARWCRAAEAVRAAAPRRTHPISAALLGDLLDGEGWAPLHDLASALAADAPEETAREAARRLTRLGHSSGWDLLAGFVAGAAV